MFSLRKINAVLAVIMILMLLNHAVLSVLYMYGIISYSPSFQITGRRLFYPLVLHIIISSYLFFNDKTRKNRVYSNLISDTTQQIVTGVCIIVFVALHILTYMMFPINSQFNFWIRLTHFIVDIGMFASITMHLRVSIPRLLVSFGFLEGKNSYHNFRYKFNILIIIILILLVLAEIIHYWVLI